jgi:hypothetical protein
VAGWPTGLGEGPDVVVVPVLVEPVVVVPVPVPVPVPVVVGPVVVGHEPAAGA